MGDAQACMTHMVSQLFAWQSQALSTETKSLGHLYTISRTVRQSCTRHYACCTDDGGLTCNLYIDGLKSTGITAKS